MQDIIIYLDFIKRPTKMQENLKKRGPCVSVPMHEASRTMRTLQNSKMAMLLFLVQIAVGFYSRRVFLHYLGTEVLGVNTTLGNILSFLNLAELGIGTAMATSLYKPIHEQDKETICEILSVQGWLYRRIALLLCGLGTAVLFVLPYFFQHTECGLLYIYIAFSVFLFGSITSYLWNYRSVLIGADQKNYKLQPWMHGVRYFIMALQILGFKVFSWGIWGWIALEFFGSIIMVFIINYVLKKEYPWLRTSDKPIAILLKKYHHLIIKTKQLFVHKLGSFALGQTTPLIIYAFVSLSMVTYYSNYLLITGYVKTLLHTIYNSVGASIGNLVSEGNKQHTLDVFWELFSSRIWLASIACFGLYVFMSPFISLWLGPEYVLSQHTLLIILTGVFIQISRPVVDSFKDAYQLFADVWAPAIEAVTNIGCSIWFGYFWGLDGILMGSNLSLILIVLIWKPYYVFKHGLRCSCWIYYKQYIGHLFLLLLCACLSISIMPTDQHANNLMQMLQLIPCFLLYIVSTYALLYITTRGMRNFHKRIINIIFNHQ